MKNILMSLMKSEYPDYSEEEIRQADEKHGHYLELQKQERLVIDKKVAELKRGVGDEIAMLKANDRLLEAYSVVGQIEHFNPTKQNLTKVLQWSSSKFNEYKKADVVSAFVDAVQVGAKTNYVTNYSSGSYSAGGAGSATSKVGGRNFSVKGTGGEYELIHVSGVPYLYVVGDRLCALTIEGLEIPSEIKASFELLAVQEQVKLLSEQFRRDYPDKGVSDFFGGASS
jgi:hypothetical protein